MKKIVKRLQASTFCHATESEEKVLTALLNIAPSSLRSELKDKIVKNIVYGYHGNPIIYYKLDIDEQKKAQEISKYILSSLDGFDSSQIKETLDLRFNRGKLHLRLDKQDAYLDKLRISEGDDVIRITISFYPHIRKRDALISALTSMGLKDA